MPASKPENFAAFWDDVDAALAVTRRDITINRDVRPPHDGVRVHRVSFTSLDAVRVGGWLTEPDRTDDGPLLTIFPGYKSDPMPAIGWARRGYRTFSVAHRGKLGATDTFNPGYPGMLTHGITDPTTYAYRGVYADCIRALDVMTEISPDAGSQAVYGYSQGGPLSLFASTRRSHLVGAVAAGAPFMTAFAYSAVAARTYPYFEIAEYLAEHPDQRDTVFATLNYFDALHVIGDVSCPLFLFRAGADEICPPYSTTLLRMLAPRETRWHEYDESGHDATGVRAVTDAAAFFAEMLGAPVPVTDVTPGPPTPPPAPVASDTLTELLRDPARISERHDLSAHHPAAATTTFVTLETADRATCGAYVSIPDVPSPTGGVVVEFSGYTSVVSLAHPEDRERFTLVTLAHRGQRGLQNAGMPWMLPGVFDDDPSATRFQQILADNAAALTALLAELRTPGAPVIGVGPDWILPIAAATGVFTHVEVDSFWLTGYPAANEFEYPRRELCEQHAAHPELAASLAAYNPADWAAKLDCDLLVVCADTQPARARAAELLDAHPGQHSLHIIDPRSAQEGEWRDARRAAILGVTPATRWQAARCGVRV